MDISNILRDRLKPELNCIYHEPRHVGGDGGWFCREHALHVYLVAQLLDVPVSIIGGEFTVWFDDLRELTSLGGTHLNGHYWNSLGRTAPLDLSLSFRTIVPPEHDIGFVFGDMTDGVYNVLSADSEEAFLAQTNSDMPLPRSICYFPRQTVNVSACELLSDPYSLLIKPEFMPLTEKYGDDIFNRVTLHLFRVAEGRTAPTYKFCSNFHAAMEHIRTHNKNATKKLRELLNI